MKSYGIVNRDRDFIGNIHIENILRKGFSIYQDLFESEICDEYAVMLNEVYAMQESEFGKDNLSKINDQNIARMPFIYNKELANIFMQPPILELVEQLLGKKFYLHLQNGIINIPDQVHHQSSWHRDFPFQDWTSSKPLGISAFVCLTDFNSDNGSTFVLPYSQQSASFPSANFIKENEYQLVANKGSVILFDSMLYHKAGINHTDFPRIGVNNMYVIPLIKQQIDIASISGQLATDSKVLEILGAEFPLDKTVKGYRLRRLQKNG